MLPLKTKLLPKTSDIVDTGSVFGCDTACGLSTVVWPLYVFGKSNLYLDIVLSKLLHTFALFLLFLRSTKDLGIEFDFVLHTCDTPLLLWIKVLSVVCLWCSKQGRVLIALFDFLLLDSARWKLRLLRILRYLESQHPLRRKSGMCSHLWNFSNCLRSNFSSVRSFKMLFWREISSL